MTPIVFPVLKILVIDITVVSDVVPDVVLLKIYQVKNKTCIKSNLENQIDPKTNYKISYPNILMKHISKAISSKPN